MYQKVTIRKFESGDADAVSDLIIENLVKKNVLEFGKIAVTQLQGVYKPQMVLEYAQHSDVYVALDPAGIVGTAGLDNGRLRNVFVKMGRHCQGIGSQLIRHLEDIAARASKLNVFLFANLAAVEFFEELGYALVEGKKETIGPVELNMMLMVKRLPHNE